MELKIVENDTKRYGKTKEILIDEIPKSETGVIVIRASQIGEAIVVDLRLRTQSVNTHERNLTHRGWSIPPELRFKIAEALTSDKMEEALKMLEEKCTQKEM